MSTEGGSLGPPRELHLEEPNKCFIISNRFEKSKQPSLSNYKIDEENITKTFTWLNFVIKKKTDLSKEKIKTFIDKISKEDFTCDKCVALFILSHGNDDEEILGDDNNYLKVDWIIKKLVDTVSLHGKPKLIFIQACRGAEDDKVVEIDEEIQEASSRVQKAQKADTFVYYCSMPGTASLVGSTQGSIFINKLCTVLQEYCENSKFHFGDVITKVNDILSRHICKGKDGSGNKKELVQVSEACSSLTSHLYFHPQGGYKDFIENFNYQE